MIIPVVKMLECGHDDCSKIPMKLVNVGFFSQEFRLPNQRCEHANKNMTAQHQLPRKIGGEGSIYSQRTLPRHLYWNPVNVLHSIYVHDAWQTPIRLGIRLEKINPENIMNEGIKSKKIGQNDFK